MLEKLKEIEDKYLYIEGQLADPSIIADMDRWSKLNKEYKSLEPVVEAYREYSNIISNIANAKEMLKDPEMKEMAQDELEALEPQLDDMEERLKVLLIPKDPEDTKDVIFEIRAGTGGDEAAIFAGDLYRMYVKFFETMGWKFEVISENEGTVGGFKEIILEVKGEEVYGRLKFESGGHRVQRVPKTESQGRVHTSAATVAVIPKIEPEELNIRKEDLKIDVYRASGAGGQHVNRTESAVRITHLPTGVVSESQDSRSQIKNRDIALTRLVQKIQEIMRREEASTLAEQRKLQVGSGDRSEKVRTYNYPQNRVTDHRLEGDAKNYNLNTVIEGDLSEVINSLKMLETAEKMKAEIE
ncbi:MAG: peptide chain release factor 1 [Saprospiraceae bacterium]|nr:peptide chain release factor 1 [Saprospiraceae bacterium]